MKKNYLKPEVELVNITINSVILSGSVVDSGVTEEPGDAAVNSGRGEWGNVWGGGGSN